MSAGYTIGEYAIRDSRADDYLLSLGRAIHIAAMFEHKSRELVATLRASDGMGPMLVEVNDLDDLFGVSRIQESTEGTYDPERWRLRELAARAKAQKQPLAHVLDRLHEEVYSDPYGVEKLIQARKGRNWIAHTAGLVFLPSSRSWTEGHFLHSFRNAVFFVAHADALVSALTWIEPEGWHSFGPPEAYSLVYPELVVTWVLEKIWDLVPKDDLPPWQPHPGGPHERLQERLKNGS